MMKRIVIAMMIGLLLAGSAGAATVSDTQPADFMSIVSVTYDEDDQKTYVDETYADNTLIPYPSHDGMAIVNQWGFHFDKYVHPSDTDKTNTFVYLEFTVYNGSVHSWSDYHLEFWNLAFTERLTVNDMWIETGAFDEEEIVSYTDSYGTGTIATFWTDDEFSLFVPGTEDWFGLHIDLTQNADLVDGFAIRQVATTTPIPGAVWLLGSGLIGLVAVRRRGNRRFQGITV